MTNPFEFADEALEEAQNKKEKIYEIVYYIAYSLVAVYIFSSSGYTGLILFYVLSVLVEIIFEKKLGDL